MTKECNICKDTKEIEDFTITKYKGEIKRRPTCKKCTTNRTKSWVLTNKEKRKKYVENYSKQNKDVINEKSKKFYYENRDVVLIKSKIYRQGNKDILKEKSKTNYHKRKNIPKVTEKRKAYSKKYNKENRETLNKKERERLKTDKLFKLTKNIRALIRQSIKNGGFSKKTKTFQILGCTPSEFKNYIESKWEPWMNWDNHGKHNGNLNFGWDLDHIIPISSANNEEEIIKLNHFTNFQPLCSKINRGIKQAKLPVLI
jgi:hypothetical protein